ncbi:MAG: patatin-like phospholipase family protein [Treponema sp.]|jgi:NTE family protein|nr:patatin-like phospholipase family protein [Treponema sp.]
MKANKNLKWALVLSGGGAKGLAHIGVLKTLEEMRFPPPSLVAGTSMGAIIGGIYACGMSAETLYKFALKEFNIVHYLDSFVFKMNGPVGRIFQIGQILSSLASRQGIDSGQRLLALFERLTEGKSFSETRIPFRCNAVDLVSGNEVVFRSGSVARAMRASMSIPGFFDPLVEGSQLLIDGGLADNMPVAIARKEGFNRILAVNVNSYKPVSLDSLKNGPGVVFRAMQTAINLLDKKDGFEADLTINATDDSSIISFFRQRELMELGERVVRENRKAVEAFFGKGAAAYFRRKQQRECGLSGG